MKLFNKKTMAVLFTGFAVFAMIGCGDSKANLPDDDSGTTNPVEDKNMTSAQAKDAMALQAAIYPILAPVSEISNCLTSTDALKQCIKDAADIDLSVDTSGSKELIEPGNSYACTKGEDTLASPEHGTFTYNKDASTGTVIFDFSENCADYGNNKRLHEELVIKACLLDLNNIIRIDIGTAPKNGTYRVEYNGRVECSPGKKSGNYSYRIIGNNNNQTKSQWTYNGSLEFADGKISADGSIRSMAKYAVGDDNATTPWNELFLGSDEEWSFTNDMSMTLGSNIVLNGKPTYIKHPNDWDGERGEGYEFYLSFEALAYNFAKNGRDITSTVSGKASASCHPEQITYATKTTMEDIDLLRDSTHHRMPSSGEMSVALPGYAATAVTFKEEGNLAKVIIGNVDYDSWTSIIDDSSCAQMNDFLDQLPQPPVKNPTPGEILVENLVFDKIDARVLSADKMSITGETNGRGVWYHLAREQGYTDGQTIGETNFSFDVMMPASAPNVPLVNVYLYNENNEPVRENVYSDADWAALQTDPIKKNWVIRTDYFEGDILDGVLYQGNFILRMGNSDYTGNGEAFEIKKYEVTSK